MGVTFFEFLLTGPFDKPPFPTLPGPFLDPFFRAKESPSLWVVIHNIGFSRLNWLGCDGVIPMAITNSDP